MRVALDQRHITGGRASRDRTMILAIDSLGDFPLDREAGGPLDAPDEMPAGSCNSVEVRRGPWRLNDGRGVLVASVTHVPRDRARHHQVASRATPEPDVTPAKQGDLFAAAPGSHE